jgi:lysyl-tRNA synthetase, class II
VIDTCTFSLVGREIRKVRQSVSRLQRAGYTAQMLYGDEIGFRLHRELEAISNAWRGDKPQRGFVMEFASLFNAPGRDELFVIGRDATGVPRGFLHFAVSIPGSALSLSSMPRARGTPNGFNEWLICEAVAWGRAKGFDHVSLNFAPFAALLDPDARLSGPQRLERDALLSLKSRLQLQLDNLLQFTRKFQPAWHRRFVVYERRRDLPRVGIAALMAEGFLPFGKRDPA